MKTITENSKITTYTIENIRFAVYQDGKLEFKSITIHVLVDNSFDYHVNGQIHLSDWIISMLQDKIIVPVDCDAEFPDYLSVMKVESISIDYILLTLLLILQKLNKDESVTFKAIQYDEQN